MYDHYKYVAQVTRKINNNWKTVYLISFVPVWKSSIQYSRMTNIVWKPNAKFCHLPSPEFASTFVTAKKDSSFLGLKEGKRDVSWGGSSYNVTVFLK